MINSYIDTNVLLFELEKNELFVLKCNVMLLFIHSKTDSGKYVRITNYHW